MSKPKITPQIRYRESLIKYANKHGVTKASRVYNTNRQYIYRWKKRYDGSKDLYKKGIIKEEIFEKMKDTYKFSKEHDDKVKDDFEIEI